VTGVLGVESLGGAIGGEEPPLGAEGVGSGFGAGFIAGTDGDGARPSTFGDALSGWNFVTPVPPPSPLPLSEPELAIA
jgi:hypothetical protein